MFIEQLHECRAWIDKDEATEGDDFNHLAQFQSRYDAIMVRGIIRVLARSLVLSFSLLLMDFIFFFAILLAFSRLVRQFKRGTENGKTEKLH
jgi:hypothetical protein